jgi:hypothetical protein
MNGVEVPLKIEEVRSRIRKMDDPALLRYGIAAKYMCSPQANHGQPPRDAFVVQLREAREEWKRRKSGTVIADSF